MSGQHRVPRAPACPRCGELQAPTYAVLCGPQGDQRVLTGYVCAAPACRRWTEFLQRQHEDDVIAAAVRRGVINP